MEIVHCHRLVVLFPHLHKIILDCLKRSHSVNIKCPFLPRNCQHCNSTRYIS